jgi:hypothetical protein
MITTLFIVIALLLMVVGFFFQGSYRLNKGLNLVLKAMTLRMGPGVYYVPEKGSKLHLLFYGLAAVSVFAAIGWACK